MVFKVKGISYLVDVGNFLATVNGIQNNVSTISETTKAEVDLEDLKVVGIEV